MLVFFFRIPYQFQHAIKRRIYYNITWRTAPCTYLKFVCAIWSVHQPMHTLKLFILKLVKMLRHVSIIRSSSGSCLFLAKITLLKIFTAWFSNNSLVMWQRVVLCRSSVVRSAQSGALPTTNIYSSLNVKLKMSSLRQVITFGKVTPLPV